MILAFMKHVWGGENVNVDMRTCEHIHSHIWFGILFSKKRKKHFSLFLGPFFGLAICLCVLSIK
jgi:hypothetical protein